MVGLGIHGLSDLYGQKSEVHPCNWYNAIDMPHGMDLILVLDPEQIRVRSHFKIADTSTSGFAESQASLQTICVQSLNNYIMFIEINLHFIFYFIALRQSP